MGNFSRSRGGQKYMPNKADEYEYVEGNTGALGGMMNDSQTDRRSSAKRVKLMASKIHENELVDYTSEDVDQTMFANGLNTNPQRSQMDRLNNTYKKTRTPGNQLLRNDGEQELQIDPETHRDQRSRSRGAGERGLQRGGTSGASHHNARGQFENDVSSRQRLPEHHKTLSNQPLIK